MRCCIQLCEESNKDLFIIWCAITKLRSTEAYPTTYSTSLINCFHWTSPRIGRLLCYNDGNGQATKNWEWTFSKHCSSWLNHLYASLTLQRLWCLCSWFSKRTISQRNITVCINELTLWPRPLPIMSTMDWRIAIGYPLINLVIWVYMFIFL